MENEGAATGRLPWQSGQDVALPAGVFSPQEVWTWARLVRGLVADLARFDPDAAPGSEAWLNGRDAAADADKWPAHRTLSAAFLRTISFHEPWSSAPDAPQLVIRHAHIGDHLEWSDRTLHREFVFHGCRFDGELFLDDLRANRSLLFIECEFKNRIFAPRLAVRGALSFKGSVLGGDLVLANAEIGATLDLREVRGEGEIAAQAAMVGDEVWAEDMDIGRLTLALARIGGSITFRRMQIRAHLNFRDTVVAGNVVLEDMHLSGGCTADRVRIDRHLELIGLCAREDLVFTGAVVGGDLVIRHDRGGCAIEGELNLTAAEIGGELVIVVHDQARIWGPRARLTLRDARAAAWVTTYAAMCTKQGGAVRSNLAGFAYVSLQSRRPAYRDSLVDGEREQLEEILRSDSPFYVEPSPYRTLATALRRAGRSALAKTIVLARYNHQMHARGTSWSERAGLFLFGLFVGFGHSNLLALLWFAGIVALGGVVGANWGHSGSFVEWLRFSVGNATPLVTLDETHKTFITEHIAPGSDGMGLRVFFDIQKLSGYLVLSFLVAGLSSFAGRPKD